MTGARNAAAFVSGVLTLVACGGGAATPTMQTAQPNVCEVNFVSPQGFERTDTFEERYPDRIGLRVGFRDESGRELHAFAGIPGEFGEGLPTAGVVTVAQGLEGPLQGASGTWVLSWRAPGPCGVRAVLGTGFTRSSFLRTLERAAIIPAQ